MQSPTRGSLTAISLIELLKDAADSGLTGMLRVEPGPFVKVVYFQDGTIAFASSNEKSDRLTEVLRLAGKLTPEQVEDAQARLKPNVSLGKTLVELGYLSPRDLLWGARAQVEGICHRLLLLTDGNYQVLEGSLPKEIIKLNLPVPQVIFEGILKSQDRAWVLQHIESPEATYGLSSDFHEKYVRYGLRADAVVSRMDGKRSLDEIAHLAGIDTFEICKMAVALQYLGLARRAPLQMALLEPKLEPQLEPAVKQEPQKAGEPEQETPVPDKTPAYEERVSLGEVVQIPTVEDLHKEPEEEPHPQEITSATVLDAEGPAEPESAEPVPAIPLKPIPVPFSRGLLTEEEEIAEVKPRWEVSRRSISAIAVLVLICASAAYYWFGVKTKHSSGIPDVPNTVLPSKKPETQTSVETTTQTSSTDSQGEPSAAMTLLQSGRIPQAAFAWKQETANRKSKFTIQLLIACQEKTVLESLQAVPDAKDFLILPLQYKGQSCYRVLYGLYETEREAQSAATRLPPVFLQQASPARAVPLQKIWQ